MLADAIAAPTSSLVPFSDELLWILIAGFVIAFLLAFSVGANDVSNSFGTSVGSGVLTVTQACILATFCEVAGATLLGYSVCDTFRKKMYKIEEFQGPNGMRELMLGSLACLVGSSVWNLVATALKMPISGTHSIIGATIGFSVVLKGWASIQWMSILRIVASWFASPLIAGFIASMIYLLISKSIIKNQDCLETGLKSLPFFYGATVFINVCSIVIGGPEVFGLNKLLWYEGLFIALMIAALVITVIALKVVPNVRNRIIRERFEALDKEFEELKQRPTSSQPKSIIKIRRGFDNTAFKPDTAADPSPSDKEADSDKPVKPPVAPKPAFLKRQMARDMEEIDLGPQDLELGERKVVPPATTRSSASGFGSRPRMIAGERFEVFKLFSTLQILTACFASFAHGTNDVSNAVAPLIPIWNIYVNGYESVTQGTEIWILFFGGIGICTGLWAWGRAVMATVGSGLTKLTPSIGFAVELGSAISVLGASKLGFPISTTHCKVGAVVIVSLVNMKLCSQDNLMDRRADEKDLEEQQGVDWKLFGNIAITWIVTVPLAAAAAALVMFGLKWLVL